MKTYASYLDAIADDRPTAVYRFYSAKGRLLYVGITFNLATRFGYHQRHASWWKKQDHVKVVWHDGRESAAAEELQAIRTEKPLSNIAGTRKRHRVSPRCQISRAALEAVAREVRGEIARYRVPTTTVAESLGISRQSLYGRMRSRIPFRDGELEALAELLNIPVATFRPQPVPA